MGTPFDDVHGIFRLKISDYELAELPVAYALDIMDGYLNSSCAYMRRWNPRFDLNRDKESRQFNNDLTDDIIEIIAIGMVYYYLSRKVSNGDNLANVMNTKDFTFFSPANLLSQIKDLRSQTEKEFKSAINAYTYTIGSDLK